jgi:hypothetical protein
MKMGVLELAYGYLPKEDLWRITVDNEDQAMRVEMMLRIREIQFKAKIVANRLGTA